ncbi:DUF4767 domain-containing protein [Fructobacillus papyrifericola]|uniref:DUF4767 domain-containing protein n=1 Tax=Fructobacillus papyrifericola TaxID=2713172 RepID=A0ABS5QTH6_9LACO|nr:DUF4767 domain-containing protein [Fructobacillus papyrifericola]MBS9335624.1 DUF4767 domain-containing protein [Fructobacillus papyrifericola]
MKKSLIWTLTIALTVGVVCLMFVLGKNSRREDGKQENRTSSAKITSSSSAKSGSTAEEANRFWSEKKNQVLSSSMAVWQKSMKQEYVGTYDGKEPNYYGILLPEDLESGRLTNQMVFEGEQRKASWNPTETEQKGLNVVAVAAERSQSMKSILYFFTVENNQPVVYVSKTNNGSQLYFEKSQNADLQRDFAKAFHS